MAKFVCEGIKELKSNPDMAKLAALLKTLYRLKVLSNKPDATMITEDGNTFPEGVSITLKVKPNAGENFTGWYDSSDKLQKSLMHDFLNVLFLLAIMIWVWTVTNLFEWATTITAIFLILWKINKMFMSCNTIRDRVTTWVFFPSLCCFNIDIFIFLRWSDIRSDLTEKFNQFQLGIISDSLFFRLFPEDFLSQQDVFIGKLAIVQNQCSHQQL